MKKLTIKDLEERNLIIFSGIVGSQAYGIATPTSDVDIKGVFVQEMEDILGMGYVEQVSDDTNDTTYYEIRRFLELLGTNNPNILELLNLPEDCVLHRDPIFDIILENQERLITRQCRYSFGGYAVEQIKKARGLNKKIVKEFPEKRKGVLDFCYVPFGQGSVPVLEYLEMHDMKPEHCGLVLLAHVRYTYGLYYDRHSDLLAKGVTVPLNHRPYRGLVSGEDANDVSLSEVPRDAQPVAYMHFNKDAYSIHCREFKEYWDWVAKRNQARFSDNMLHGKGYDGKNCAHALRLLEMAIEIGEGKGIVVRRSNREELLSIRRGEYEYDNLISRIETLKNEMEIAFDSSLLPDSVDMDLLEEILLTIRKTKYSTKVRYIEEKQEF